MTNTHINSLGQTYDYKSIKKWFEIGKKTDPLTSQKLSDLRLVPNIAIRSLILDWIERRKKRRKQIKTLERKKNEILQRNKLEAERIKLLQRLRRNAGTQTVRKSTKFSPKSRANFTNVFQVHNTNQLSALSLSRKDADLDLRKGGRPSRNMLSGLERSMPIVNLPKGDDVKFGSQLFESCLSPLSATSAVHSIQSLHRHKPSRPTGSIGRGTSNQSFPRTSDDESIDSLLEIRRRRKLSRESRNNCRNKFATMNFAARTYSDQAEDVERTVAKVRECGGSIRSEDAKMLRVMKDMLRDMDPAPNSPAVRGYSSRVR